MGEPRQLAFLNYITTLPHPETVEFQSVSESLKLVINDREELVVVAGTIEHTSLLMESIGSGVVTLLEEGLKSSKVLGPYFVHCLKHLSSVVRRQVGLEEESAAEEPRNQASSSVLLQLEDSQTESFMNALTLYVVAGVCETMGDRVLHVVDHTQLLTVLSAIVQCHSSSSVVVRYAATEARDPIDEVIGGHVTLSVSFGFLSAILASSKIVSDYQTTPTCS